MASAPALAIDLLPGARRLLAAHAETLPQRDDLCGAFCGALALRAGEVGGHDGAPIDQDAVALAAGSVISAEPEPHNLPHGEHSRRDYRLALPLIEDATVSGTTPAGLAQAVERLSDGTLAALPYTTDWSAGVLAGLFDLLGSLERPVSLVANIATRQLWGGGASLEQLLAYLLDGTGEGPRADWDVGHFVCLVGRVVGPAGTLYGVADTYRSLGSGGLHLQPAERLARALQRPDMTPGGVIVIAAAEDAPAVRSGGARLRLDEGAWDNGTVLPEMLA
jgi:hypothetical protein